MDNITGWQWFGLAAPGEQMKFSIISLFNRALTEDEFVRFPMLFREKSNAEKRIARQEYSRLFWKYLAHSSEVTWKGNSPTFNKVADLNRNLDEFLHEKKLRTYVDGHSGMIFHEEPYLEIHIFSKNNLNLSGFRQITLREHSTPVAWRDTIWGTTD